MNAHTSPHTAGTNFASSFAGTRLRMRQFDLIAHNSVLANVQVPLATTAYYGSPPGKHRNDPKQIQPGKIAQGQARMLEKQVQPKIRLCGIVVGLQRMRDAANCKIMRNGYATIRRIPRDGAAAKHLPAECQCAERPDPQTEPAQRKQSNRTAAEGQ